MTLTFSDEGPEYAKTVLSPFTKGEMSQRSSIQSSGCSVQFFICLLEENLQYAMNTINYFITVHKTYTVVVSFWGKDQDESKIFRDLP